MDTICYILQSLRFQNKDDSCKSYKGYFDQLLLAY